ncbi:MAG: DUF3160 domain-containing protein [Fimbriimonadales bacterium]|nr:MAG: hypothetical protein KatS3mg018_2640 [Fimbriimonadales bacterium]
MRTQQKPYRLDQVVNLDQYAPIPAEARELLERNGFLLQKGDWEQPFFIYEANAYDNIPHFVTLDSMLHLYHLCFQFTLRRLEARALAPRLAQFTRRLLRQCVQTYQQAPTPELKAAALRNVAYVGVAARLQNLNDSLPDPALPMVRRELELIREHKEFREGAILPYAIDYTQFQVRGHYTRTATLQRYFRAMMWYGLFPFAPRRLMPGRTTEPTPMPVRQALLLTDALYRANLVNEWQQLMTPIDFFVGGVDDLTPPEVRQAAERVFGRNPSLRMYADRERFARFMEAFCKLRMPAIRPKIVSLTGALPPLPDPNSPQMRLLGQRYVPDSEVLQELRRPVPSGLDVMAALGSRRAAQHLDAQSPLWSEYLPTRRRLTDRFAALGKREWTRNLYWGWLWVLQSIAEPPQDARLPALFRTDAWRDKSLQTALASWAQLRHDTILYAKQSVVAAEGGDVEPEPEPRYHFVEPNTEAWSRLLELIRLTLKIPFVAGAVREELSELEALTAFLLACARKQLANRNLTRAELERLHYIGGEMDTLAVSVVGDGKASGWYEIEHPADRRMACIADVHTAIDRRPGGVGEVALEAGVGYAHEILVLVPAGNRFALARGASFSYYEFTHPVEDRLTDEKWQLMLNPTDEELQAQLVDWQPAPLPDQPAWVQPLYTSEPVQIKPAPLGEMGDE